MDKLKIAVLIVLSLLMVVYLIDQHRRPEQMHELKQALDETSVEFKRLRTLQQQLQRQQRDLIEVQEALVAALRGVDAGELNQAGLAAIDDGSSGTEAAATGRDGRVVEGRNFLKPLNYDSFDPEKSGGTLRSFGQEPDGFNDVLTSMGATAAIHRQVNDSLCNRTPTPEYAWQEALAESVIISDDYTTFTFTIREGVTWQIPPLAYQSDYEWLQEEVPLTAHDFVFYLDMVRHDAVECPHLKPYYEKVAAVEAPDDHTLVLRWSEKEYTNIEFSLGLSPLPRHIYTRDRHGAPLPQNQVPIVFNEHWFDEANQVIGVGPYVLTEYVPQQYLLFERNPAYYGVPLHFERLRWDLQTRAPDAQLVAFKNNQVHTHGLRPSQYKAEVLDRHDERFAPADPNEEHPGRDGPFGWERIESNRWYGICWNLRRPVLAEASVRQALAHCYPFERILDQIMFGLGRRLAGPVHPGSPYHDPTIEPFTFDLVAARRLLDEGGWKDSDNDGWRDKTIDGEVVPLRIRVTHYSQFRTFANLLSLFSEECKKVGIDLKGDPVEDQEWVRRADNRDFDGFAIVWSSGLEVDYKQLWFGEYANEPKSSNYAGYADERVDELIEEMRLTFDHDERVAISRAIQRRIYRDQPYLFASSSVSVFTWHNKPVVGGDDRELLGGVLYGFEHYHPLLQTTRDRWYLILEQ